MAHLPVNHPSRPFFRIVTFAVGGFLAVFGLVGIIVTWGEPLFDRGDHWVFGLRTNPAFALLSLLVGLVVASGAVYGRNVDHFLNLGGGMVFLLSGFVMQIVLHTPLNLLNFSLTNCSTAYVIGMIMLTAGLYGKTGSPQVEEDEDKLRHGGDSTRHSRAAVVTAPNDADGRSGAGVSLPDARARSRPD